MSLAIQVVIWTTYIKKENDGLPTIQKVHCLLQQKAHRLSQQKAHRLSQQKAHRLSQQKAHRLHHTPRQGAVENNYPLR
jgi:hypothetical protein